MAVLVAMSHQPNRGSRASRFAVRGSCVGGETDEVVLVREQLQRHLTRLWDHAEVPKWHRDLYAKRYFSAGRWGGTGLGASVDVLHREAEDLVAGTSIVQRVQASIVSREAALTKLAEVRGTYQDSDFQKGGARKSLAKALRDLRKTSLEVVELLAVWRRSVAPLPGKARLWEGGLMEEEPTPLRAIASPPSRGACWPVESGAARDYIQRLAHDDKVLRSFSNVLELVRPGQVDPFLVATASAGKPIGKLHPPPVDSILRERVEMANHILLEDLVSVTLVGTLTPAVVDLDGSLPMSLRGSRRASGQAQHQIHSLLPFLAKGSQRTASKQTGTAPQSPARSRGSARSPGSVSGQSSAGPTSPMGRASGSLSSGQPGGTKSSNSGASPDLPLGMHAGRRRAATINRMKIMDGGQGLPLIPELRDLTPNSTALVWKGKNNGTPQATKGLPMSTHSSESPGPMSESPTKDDAEDLGSMEIRPPTVDLIRINTTFRRYSLDGFVHEDDLEDCLKRLGFLHPNMEWADAAFHSLTSFGVLDAAEFMLFISGYEDRMRAHIMEDFKRFDVDDSGRLEVDELAELLLEMHVEPMPHVLEEVLGEVDKDDSGTLDFEEFFEVVRLLQEREGFTKSEYDSFIAAFQLFDRDKSGEMDEQELIQVLNYLGYEVSQFDAQAVTSEVDFDGTGALDQHEFIVCMRKLREREIQSLKTAMLMHDVDMNGTINVHELQTILYSIGYMPDDTVIFEVLEDLNLDADRCELNFATLWRFMVALRHREGLCRADEEAVQAAFERYKTGSEVNAIYVAKILRFMGFSMTFDEKQTLISQVDVDDSGALGLTELRKLFRICREQRGKAIRLAFRCYATSNAYGNPSASKVIPLSAAPEALRSIGCLGERQEMPTWINEVYEDGLDMSAFFKLARKLFHSLELEVRQNGGYSSTELRLMHDTFLQYDEDKSNTIRNHELVNLVKAVFPAMATDPKLRPQLKEIIKEADEDGNGELDFDDFLRLMRMVYELRNRNQLKKERRAVHDTEFLPHEVHEFRGLFIAQTGTSHSLLEFEDLEALIGTICPLGDRNLHALGVLWREALSVYEDFAGIKDSMPKDRHDGVSFHGKEGVDFPEFLWLMRQILSRNFANVNERTRKLANPNSPDQPAQAWARAPPENSSPGNSSRTSPSPSPILA